MKNQFLSLNQQLFALPLLTLLLSPGQALALFPSTNPCTPPVNPVDTSNPTTVVGNGTPASCTEAAFDDAVDKGGAVTFNCGSSPYILTLTSEKTVTKSTVIDGKGLVTLSGGGKVRILSIKGGYTDVTPSLTVQNLNFGNGYTTDVPNTKAITQGGAAIYRAGGTLTVINSNFYNNVAPLTGQDVAGGAIYSVGVGKTTIVGSIFKGNKASNGGSIGNLGNSLTIYNSQVVTSAATGNGGNSNDGGNGGNGGGIYIDGANNTVDICGVRVASNQANAFGGGLTRVTYIGDRTIIDKSTFDSNVNSSGQGGGLYLQGTTLTLQNSTISNNKSVNAGGMVYFGGYGVGPMLFNNVTVSGNTASNEVGGGIGIAYVSGTISNSTFANNKAAYNGGGLRNGSGLSLQNNIFSNNTPSNCDTTLTEQGGNIQYPNGTQCSNGITVADPLLGTLYHNGGPTSTIAPASNSPAANNGSYNCPATDQRGQNRPSTSCTSGAYQLP